MKCFLSGEMTLVVHPTNPVEHYALKTWLEEYKEGKVKLEISLKVKGQEKETHEVPYHE